MRLTAGVLVLCAFAAVAESQSVTARGAPQQKSERNVLTSAISGIQHAVGAALGGVLQAAAIGAAEGAIMAAIKVAEKLGEKLVHHNSFAVRILQCLADAARQTTHTAADTAEGAVDQVEGAVAGALHRQGKHHQAAAAQKRGLLDEAAGAARACVVGALQETVHQLDEQAQKLAGNDSKVAVAALQALEEAIEKNVKSNPVVLQSLDGAVGVTEQVVSNLTYKADDVIDRMAHNADDLVDSVAKGTHSKRNLLNDVVDQMKAAFAENLAEPIDDATSSAEIKVEDLIARAEKAADEALQKAQLAVDDNLVEGSYWERALVALLKKAEGVKEQLANNAEMAVHSAAEMAQQVADSISSS